MLVRMDKEPHIVGGNVNQCGHYGNQYGGSLKKLKINLPYELVMTTLGHLSEEV
jgi:hypothetical protein